MQSNKITEWQTITNPIHLRNKNIVKSLLFFCEKHLVARAISLLRIITKLFTAIYSKVQKLFRKCFSLWGPLSRVHNKKSVYHLAAISFTTPLLQLLF